MAWKKAGFAVAAVIAVMVVLAVAVFSVTPPKAKAISYGVVFSQKHAQNLGLDWKETYRALLDDLGVNNVKIASYWDLLEPQAGQYAFDDLDWQIDRAAERGASVMLVVGMKTPRWPECHIPAWAQGLGREKQQAAILSMIETVVRRYQDRPAVKMWQVENEPLFPFGECPWMDEAFLQKEAALVKSLDANFRPVLISDSGESSLWFEAAEIGDVVGVTMYRKVWFHEARSYVSYPIPPSWYWLKAKLVDAMYKKKVICVELQEEPWCPNLLYDCSVAEQAKTMDASQFEKNLDFARRTGLDTFYLWGGEWWFWQKQKNNNDAFWNEAKTLWQ